MLMDLASTLTPSPAPPLSPHNPTGCPLLRSRKSKASLDLAPNVGCPLMWTRQVEGRMCLQAAAGVSGMTEARMTRSCELRSARPKASVSSSVDAGISTWRHTSSWRYSSCKSSKP